VSDYYNATQVLGRADLVWPSSNLFARIVKRGPVGEAPPEVVAARNAYRAQKLAACLAAERMIP
jgi:hypothetical protein